MAIHKAVLRVSCIVLVAASAGTAVPAARGADPKPSMRQYESPYYIIHTDLEPNMVREVYARLTSMAEEYHERTSGFSRTINKKFPFYLYSDEKDYLDAGGLKGSAGQFTGKVLMAQATPETGGRLWHVLQHEGFHQFAYSVISDRLPTWLNEGLAEYFGEGVWTGDGMVTGGIPQGRLKKVRQLIEDRQIKSFTDIMDISPKEWSANLDSNNYTQVWSMVHFLVNGEGGKYCPALSDFINDISRGGVPKLAFANRFGRDDKAFQSRYEQWWTSLKDYPTNDLYLQAETAKLTSFLARAQYLKMKLATPEALFAALAEGKIQVDGEKHPSLWLPASLGQAAAGLAPKLGDWTLEAAPAPRLVLKRSEGEVFRGTFTLSGDQRPQVKVAVEKPPPDKTPTATSAPATKASPTTKATR